MNSTFLLILIILSILFLMINKGKEDRNNKIITYNSNKVNNSLVNNTGNNTGNNSLVNNTGGNNIGNNRGNKESNSREGITTDINNIGVDAANVNRVKANANKNTSENDTENNNKVVNSKVSHIELQMTSRNNNKKNNLVLNNIEAFQNNASQKSVTLFYSKICPHSLAFLKVWHTLLDEEVFSDDVQLTSVECGKKPEICKNNNITSVPTLVIQNQSKKHSMTGNQTLENVLEQCRLMGFYLKKPIEEGFSSAYYISGGVANKFIKKSEDGDCPLVSFSRYEDYNRNNNFCVSGDHASGCIKGVSGSKVQDFEAAYAQVGSYLVSLPDNSQEKMNKCAARKAESIRKFNLCGKNEKLNILSNYGKDVKDGKSTNIFLDTDFSDNVKISNAIRHACNQT